MSHPLEDRRGWKDREGDDGVAAGCPARESQRQSKQPRVYNRLCNDDQLSTPPFVSVSIFDQHTQTHRNAIRIPQPNYFRSSIRGLLGNPQRSSEWSRLWCQSALPACSSHGGPLWKGKVTYQCIPSPWDLHVRAVPDPVHS